MPGPRNPIAHRSENPKLRICPADLISDWAATLQQHELGYETRQTLDHWCEWFKHGGTPPEPLPLNPSDVQVEQAFRSFMRNAYRTARLDADGRLHDLRQTVTELVSAMTSQARLISAARVEVHNLLHQIEDALPESTEVSGTCSAVRHRLRELDNEAQRARSSLNERLQEMRSSMLARLGNVGEVVDNEARRSLFFRTLCGAAGLFGEKVTIVAFEVAGRPRDAERVAATARSVFQRDSDIVSRIATEVSTISIDTPDKHILRLVAAVGEQLPAELRASCIVSIAFGTQNARTVAEALSDASRTTLPELLASADASG